MWLHSVNPPVRVVVMVYSEYTKQRIVYHYKRNLKPSEIVKALESEEIKASRSGIWRFLKRYKTTGTTARKKGSGRSRIISDNEKQIIEQTMQKDDETTIAELVDSLKESGHVFSKSTVLRCRKQLGWTSRGSAYCQLIRENNKKKRLLWARKHAKEAEKGFKNVVFTDETSVQLESHRRFACRKVKQAPKPKPRYDGDCYAYRNCGCMMLGVMNSCI